MGISAIDDTCNILSGRPYGGLAILIRRKIRPICDFIFYDDTRIMGIQIKNRDECLYFVNVYLPYQCPDNYDLYVEYLGKLSAIIEDYDSSKVGIIGDFNAAVGTTFEGELLEVCTHHELIISDYEHFGRNSSQFTFVSDAHSTTSWLDHIICSFNLFTILSDLCILDKLPSSDHLPIGCNLCFDLDTCMSTPSVSDSCDVKLPTMKCQWSKASDVEIEYYRMKSYISLDTIFIPDVVKCVNNNCSSKEHQGQLDSYFTSISDALDLTSKQTIPTSKIKCPSEYIVPGFNDYLKDLHDSARNSYLVWKQNGKPRGDDTDMDMRTTRLRFKYALRQCRCDEEQNRTDALARSLHCKDTTDFWKGVRGIKDSRVPLATKVGDAVGDANITKLWQDHFSALLNSVQNEGSKPFVCESIDHDMHNEDTIVITAPDVRECLKTIKLGKAAGLDGLAAEHFVFSHSIICVHLSLLFTSILIHGYLPASLMKSAIVPILKNRQGDTSDKNNYRPIAIVTAISKIFELCLMNLIESHLITKDNQFGFKKKHSTELCIFTVKSVIKYYNLYNSPVYSCFLDASKAYDRVSHWALFKKLLKRSNSVIIVRILMFWYSKQEICIKWGNETSTCFTITNGVRQGGILSPTLFSIYMDDLSFILSESGIGCHIDDLCINHVFYADDLCLMAPCAIALQELIGLCYEYSVDIDLNFNATKSYCVAFTPKLYKLALPSLHINHLPISYTDSIKYLGYIFTSDNSDDAEMLRQMRLLYCRSNRLIRMFNKCSQNVLIELCRSFCTTFYCLYF